jgi:AraC-like DNA-binding protein
VAVLARAPRVALREHVRSYYGFREDAAGPVRRREGPGADVVLVVSFGHEWDIDGARHTSFIGGLHDRQVVTEHAGTSYGMQVNLPPPAAFALLRVPLHTLAQRTVGLADVLGRRGDELVERLADAPSWDARFELLDTAFATRLADAPSPSPGVVWAYERLRATHGHVRVRALAEELGWSRKRLAARFRTEIGLTPKTLARLLRYERATALLGRPNRAALGEIAFACGYYDQAHLTNEIRRIAGVTPAAYAANFQDAAAPAS